MVYGKFIGTLILIGGLGLAGGVIYLPFLLWFRRRRRRTRAITVETRITRAGVLFAALPVGVLFGGFAAGVVAPQSLLGSLTEGIRGILIWGLFTVLLTNVIERQMRKRGFVAARRVIRLPVVRPRPAGGGAAGESTPARSTDTLAASQTAEVLPGEPDGATDELAFALAVVSTRGVQTLYAEVGTQAQAVVARLYDLRHPGRNWQIDQLLDAGSPWHLHMSRVARSIPLEVRLLIGLIAFGSPATRGALTPDDGLAGDIPFLVAHGRLEAELHSEWPRAEDQSGDLSILNDLFSPIEAVLAALEASFGLTHDDAIVKMREAYESGATSLQIPSAVNVQKTCQRLNHEWRSAGLALYCVPNRATAIEHGQ
jgi:hypothetical protein